MPAPQQRPKSLIPTIAISAVVVIVVFGIAYYLRVKAQKPADFSEDSSSAVSLGSVTASPDIQATAEHNLHTFLDDLRHQNYSHALGATAKNFPDPHSADALRSLAQNQTFQPIFAGPIKFEPAHLGSHGRNLILRGKIQANGKPYRVVCTLVNDNNTWLISSLRDPVPPSLPPVSQSSGAAASPH